jgi:hypothetical protein
MKGSFSYMTVRAQVLVYVSPHISEDAPVIFVIHGITRKAMGYMRQWMKHIGERPAVIVAPRFDKARAIFAVNF